MANNYNPRNKYQSKGRSGEPLTCEKARPFRRRATRRETRGSLTAGPKFPPPTRLGAWPGGAQAKGAQGRERVRESASVLAPRTPPSASAGASSATPSSPRGHAWAPRSVGPAPAVPHPSGPRLPGPAQVRAAPLSLTTPVPPQAGAGVTSPRTGAGGSGRRRGAQSILGSQAAEKWGRSSPKRIM